jgi:hypothetical protein
MGEVIGEYLPLAVALAIIPIPIIAVILMLFSDHARSNSLAFLGGWLVAVAVTMAVLVALTSVEEMGTADDPSESGGWVAGVIGVLLIALAAKQWRSRPAPGEEAKMPGWMSRIDSMRPPGAAGLAIVLAVLNPKNLLLIAGGAVVIAQGDLGTTDQIVAIAIFTLIASLSIATPTLGYLFLGERAQPALDRSKAWLLQHNAAVMAVLLLVIGVVLLGKGIAASG